MNIKKLTKKDTEGYKELFVYCFNMKEDDARQYAKTCLECGKSIGVEENDRLVSAMAYYPYEANIHNTKMNMAGVTGVVTAPEARNRGYVREQLIYLQNLMRRKNLPISYLEPFKYSYYEKFGWTAASQSLSVVIKVDNIRKIDEKFEFVKIEKPNANDFFEIGQKFSSLFHGCSYRNKCLWKNSIFYSYYGKKNNFYIIKNDGEDIAYVGLHFNRIKNEFQVNMSVIDYGFKNYKGIQGLFSFFKTHRDQCRFVQIALPVNFDLYHFSPFRPKKIKLNFDKMFKVVDVKNAMLQLKPSKNINFDLKINITKDNICPENTGEFSFKIKGGKISECNNSKNFLEGDINNFSKLFIGKSSIKKLMEYNEIKIEGEIIDDLNILFPEKPIYVKDWF
ncbi:MAG: GNAT family N-acetyltransferase [Candidatus Cloacimonetes bacterium]|nr:GNAT family N-acetyltransferase [Candidatus Cloacimonadota bacterium]MBS3767359.1 GNAT family N-acetyltransferase [Candidatus Cloacimonadota bacterium]